MSHLTPTTVGAPPPPTPGGPLSGIDPTGGFATGMVAGAACGLLIGALVVWVYLRARPARRSSLGPGPAAWVAPPDGVVAPPAWREVDYGVAAHPEPEPAAVAERLVLVRWCIDVADRLQDRDPALAARLRRGLSEVGVLAHDPGGEPFDAVRCDAVGSEVTTDFGQDRLVAHTRLLGYSDRDSVLRRPEVVVYRLAEASDV